jgi:AraC-like DNA-binding protein
MKRALAYLYQRKYSVKEISDMLGYPDQYTFSKAFSRVYDFPPSYILSNYYLTGHSENDNE